MDVLNAATLYQNQSLKAFNTFGIEAHTAYFWKATTPNEVKEALTLAKTNNWPLLILGGGSNILLCSNWEGLVLQVALKGISVVPTEKPNEVLITAAAGERWHNFVLHSLELGLYGMENLSLIPGCIGAAPMQNIGAYGAEIKDTFHSLIALNRDTLEYKTFTKEECGFGYRESVFKGSLKDQYIILSVTFKLSAEGAVNIGYGDIQKILEANHVASPGPIEVSRAVITIRESKLPNPAEIGNAGSFFKNPEIPEAQYQELAVQYPTMPHYPTLPGQVKIPAGWLIEQCGWKGKKMGTHQNYGVHEKQALVLVNYGGATGEQIWDLAIAIQADVFQKFGITIQPEVNLIKA